MVERFFSLQQKDISSDGISLISGPPSSWMLSIPERERERAMVERFFSLQQKDISSDGISLISGPPSSGKTSLLFQYAYNSASSTTVTVVFICNQQRLERNPPFLSQGIDPSSDPFQRIQIKYVEDEEGVKKYFAAFHLFNKFPHTVIIDDFGDLFNDRSCQERYNSPRGRDLAMIRTLALCRNAIDHANARGQCSLLLSDTHPGDSPRLLFIYKRWVSSIYTIKGDGAGSFILKNMSSTSSSTNKKVAKYSVALQYLTLEGISEETEC